MKILGLRFKNLNALYGEWAINFTDPEYGADGIFALTGPTGAGKTTVLDAICLALYGRTPRLDKLTRSGNEIMSRRTGECFAEVTFETQSGRFRCHWSQHRARRKPDGELQAPQHEIADADSGVIFESRIKAVAERIESATGMDFDRFTRSMLLAQGGFDTFLKADIEQKSKILEQITGTGIYSEISRRVHERQRDAREKLSLLQAETSGIVMLAPEREKEIQETLEAKHKEEAYLAAKYIDTGKAIAWRTIVDGLKKEILDLADEAIRLQSDIEAFRPCREKLGRAVGAASLDGVYATLTATRKQQADDSTALKVEEAALPDLESSAREQVEALKLAEEQTIRAKKERETAAPVLQRVRALDQKLADRKKAVSQGDEDCRKDAAKIDAEKKARLEEREKRSKADETLKRVDGYLEEHGPDEWLIGGLAGIEEQLNSLLSRHDEILQKKTDHDTSVDALEQATKVRDDRRRQRGVYEQELEKATTKRRQGEAALSRLLGERLLREYRAEKETLLREMAYLAKIAALEEHRAKLEDGKPCPLCGATEHPFAEGNVPLTDETARKIDTLTRLIRKAEDQEAAIGKLEETERLARKNLTEVKGLESAAANNEKAAEKTLAAVKNGLEKFQADFAERRQTVSTKLLPLGIADISETDITSVLETLGARLKAWQEQVGKKVETEKEIAAIDSEMKRLDAVLETQLEALTEKRISLERLRKEHGAGMDERKRVYGDKNPDEEESHLNQAIAAAEATEKKAGSLNAELQRKLTTAKSRLYVLKKRIDRRTPELKKMETDFSATLIPAGFADEKRFLEARLTNEERDTFSSRARELDHAWAGLETRRKDRERRLAAEKARKLTDKTLEELEPQGKEYGESLKQLRDAIAALKHKLNEHAAAKKRIEEKQTVIEAQKKVCHRWEKLHRLIGSADGKKYRNFAQGLTFESMVSHANRQLEKMTDRYLLIRDERQPLELNVVDTYQAGDIRSTRNLSGGESFIVSLALALGLSQMASRKVRVDSLFLDEGFATLDEDALETALETLSGLHREGKLIGVISHVSALKQRIGTQITITPISGGRSALSGPGCTKIVKRQ